MRFWFVILMHAQQGVIWHDTLIVSNSVTSWTDVSTTVYVYLGPSSPLSQPLNPFPDNNFYDGTQILAGTVQTLGQHPRNLRQHPARAAGPGLKGAVFRGWGKRGLSTPVLIHLTTDRYSRSLPYVHLCTEKMNWIWQVLFFKDPARWDFFLFHLMVHVCIWNRNNDI